MAGPNRTGWVMATTAEPQRQAADDRRFFLIMALVMAGAIAAGFSMQLAAGRSSFGAPLLVHVHAVVFFAWVVLYVLQSYFVASNRPALHRTLGWIGAAWVPVMVVVGTAVTVAMLRKGGVPFFFTPIYFLVMDILCVIVFAGLTAAAIVMRRRTDWHRRLHYCGMAYLSAPGVARLLPLPFMVPWVGWGVLSAILVFPLIGVLADWRRSGRVHPAWWWGIGAMIGGHVAIALIVASPLGPVLYEAATAGSPGAAVPGFDYPPPPRLP
jgi:hypothetical protein